MALKLAEKVYKKFSTGLNTVDNAHDMEDSDLTVCENVLFKPTGEAQSMNGHLQIGNDIRVNGIPATDILGGTIFNSKKYLMASNGIVARIIRSGTLAGTITGFANAGGGLVTVTDSAHGLHTGDIVTISGTTAYNGTYTITVLTANTFNITVTFATSETAGTWTSVGWVEVSSQDFSATARCDMQAYSGKIWIVNGLTTNSNVLHFVDTSDVLTGLTTASGLPSGINHLCLHLERFWISKGNAIYVSIQYPTGANSDWNAGVVYSGSATAGLIQIDDNPNDEVLRMLSHFGSLVVFRKLSIHVVNGQQILTQTIQKAFNTKGVLAPFSISRGDTNIYFLSPEAIKQFSGVAALDQTTQFDTISSIGIDRKIRSTVDGVVNLVGMVNLSECVGYAFGDKYYISDRTSKILIFDEITNGWSDCTIGAAQLFLEENGMLYGVNAESFFQINADPDASVSSRIKTKEFNLDTNQFYKSLSKISVILRRFDVAMDVTLDIYLDGNPVPNVSVPISVASNAVYWDSSATWDSGIDWDSSSVYFTTAKERNAGTCINVAFGLRASGVNRFLLSTFDILYETLRRES